MLKAFVLCQNITDNPANKAQKDLRGAGLSRMDCVDPLPVNRVRACEIADGVGRYHPEGAPPGRPGGHVDREGRLPCRRAVPSRSTNSR